MASSPASAKDTAVLSLDGFGASVVTALPLLPFAPLHKDSLIRSVAQSSMDELQTPLRTRTLVPELPEPSGSHPTGYQPAECASSPAPAATHSALPHQSPTASHSLLGSSPFASSSLGSSSLLRGLGSEGEFMQLAQLQAARDRQLAHQQVRRHPDPKPNCGPSHGHDPNHTATAPFPMAWHHITSHPILSHPIQSQTNI